MDPLAAAELNGLPVEQAYLVAASVRAATDAKQILEITGPNLLRLREAAPRWTSPFEGVDRLLVLMGSRLKGFLAPVTIQKDVDFPLICAMGEKAMNEIMVLAGQLGYIDSGKLVFTIQGLRRLDELRATTPDSRQAFVAMWFDKSLDAAWDEGLKPGIESANYFRAVRVDNIEHSGRIDDRIVAEIRRSGLVVADFTGDRGGVYFEAGLAQGLHIPVIWTCQEDWVNKLHFDTRQYNHIVWSKPADLRDRLSQRIAATLLPQGWGNA